MLTGDADGMPPIADVDLAERWVAVCTDVYERVVDGRGGRVLRSYAGVNPAEFFAVATEAFFDAPVPLRGEHPELYDVLGRYYGQDPASRLP
jgi:Mlc titration factor MtfA (ptsG expression regulator)